MAGRYRTFMIEAKNELRQNGFRSLIRRYGWRVIALVFTTYLVRDVTLYVLLPWLVARSLVAQ